MKFEVWHAVPRGNFLGDRDYAAKFPEGYEHVADVEAAEPHQVYQLTNHIDTPWTQNPEVTVHTAQARSTSVGDVLVHPDGRREMYDWLGFWEIP